MARSVASRAGGGTRLAVAAFIVALLSLALAAVRPPATSAQDPVTTLSGITVNGVAVTDFDPEVTAYTVGLANAVATATVVATPTATGAATVACGRDDDGEAEGCQVALTADAGVDLALTVTNGSATRTYTVTLNRGRAGDFQWKASDDIYGLARLLPADTVDVDRTNLRGVWGDGTTLWVANAGRNKSVLYAFNLETGAHEAQSDLAFGTFLTGSAPTGVGGLDGLIFVGDREYRDVFAFERDVGNAWVRVPTQDWVDVDAPQTLQGIWLTSEFLYGVKLPASGSVYVVAYTRPNVPEHDDSFNNLETHSNTKPRGIYSDGETLWVADSAEQKLFAYDLVTKARTPAKDFNTVHLTVKGTAISPWGIWSDGQTMWISDTDSQNVYSFNMPASTNTDLRQLRAGGVDVPRFDPALRTQTVSVGNDQTSVTISVVPRNVHARAVITSADADAITEGHQIDLSGGPAVVTVTVTALVGGTTGAYTLTFSRKPALLAAPTIVPLDGALGVIWSAPSDPGTSGVTAYDCATPGSVLPICSRTSDGPW